MAQTLAELDHPAVRLCFDTGRYLQLNPEASGEIALQRVLGAVGTVRLSDYDLANDQAARWLGAGLGVDFGRTLQILESVEFAGPCVISFPSVIAQRTGLRPLTSEEIRSALSQSLATLRGSGWFSGG
jgi:hypothetical protein